MKNMNNQGQNGSQQDQRNRQQGRGNQSSEHDDEMDTTGGQ
jgi:hypothetical protein